MDLQRNTLNSEHLGNNGWVSRSKYSLIKTNYFTFLLFFFFPFQKKVLTLEEQKNPTSMWSYVLRYV